MTTSSLHGAPARRLRVLAADDHPLTLLLIEVALEAAADVVGVGTGAEAVAAFASGPFDLVVMDVDMPVMDGLTAIRRIRGTARGACVPIVVMSAASWPDELAASRAAGADRHLVKPVPPHRLLATLLELTGARAGIRAA